MNKLVLAGFFLVLVLLGGAYDGSRFSVVMAAGQASGASATNAMTWMTVRDKREQAFSVQVPEGWKTYGGLFRYSAIDARMIVDMTSPDGLTNLRLGDSAVPPYRVPGPFLAPGPGVAVYAPGDVFSKKYGQARFAAACQGLQLTKNQAIAPKYHAASSGITRTTAGEAFFSCTKNGQPMSAYVYAETTLMGPGGPGSSWLIVALGSLIAPADKAAAAGAMLQHTGESLVMNPAWLDMQNRLNNLAIQQINASTQATIAATSAMDAHQRAMISALQNDSFIDVINGVQQTRDTTTGQQYTVPLGTGGTQWVNGNRVVVESGLSPGAGFNRLTPINR
ncbi:MAG TPA: hypothetical protein VGJ21_21785 [Terracidiphilus sp.]